MPGSRIHANDREAYGPLDSSRGTAIPGVYMVKKSFDAARSGNMVRADDIVYQCRPVMRQRTWQSDRAKGEKKELCTGASGQVKQEV